MSEELVLDESQENGYSVAASTIAAEQARAVQEVQAGFVIAKRFPRDHVKVRERVLSSCKRLKLAEHALYAYTRGSTQVTGPSVVLARAIARAFGNLRYGVRVLSQTRESTELQTYCLDLETNSGAERNIRVPHQRYANKTVIDISAGDPRDVRELVLNVAGRLERACIMEVIPEDLVDEAVAEVYRTLQEKGGKGVPLAERVPKMIALFEKELAVKTVQIETLLGHNADAIIEPEMVRLQAIYNAIKNGFARREDYFPPEVEKPDPRLGDASKNLDDIADRDLSAPINEAQHKMLVDAIHKSGVGDVDLSKLLDKHGFAETTDVTGEKFSAVLKDVLDLGKGAKHRA